MTRRYGPWEVAEVRRHWADPITGLVLGPFGLAPTTGWLRTGERLGVNHRGEVLAWGLYMQSTGKLLCCCRDPWVAAALCAELGELDPALWTEAPPADRRRLVGPTLTKWASEGDAAVSGAIREAAIEVASDAPGWGR